MRKAKAPGEKPAVIKRPTMRSARTWLVIYRVVFSAQRCRIPARNFCLSFCISRTSA
jgi:hypothetical protein